MQSPIPSLYRCSQSDQALSPGIIDVDAVTSTRQSWSCENGLTCTTESVPPTSPGRLIINAGIDIDCSEISRARRSIPFVFSGLQAGLHVNVHLLHQNFYETVKTTVPLATEIPSFELIVPALNENVGLHVRFEARLKRVTPASELRYPRPRHRS